MSTKPWEDRVHLVANHGEKAAMVEELDELRQENARLRAEVDQWKVDFTEVLTDTKRLRAALTTARTALIEHGSAYLHHELRYQEALDAARAALGNKS